MHGLCTPGPFHTGSASRIHNTPLAETPGITPSFGHVRIRLETQRGTMAECRPFSTLGGPQAGRDLLAERPPVISRVRVLELDQRQA
jgi:hypothetical protein